MRALAALALVAAIRIAVDFPESCIAAFLSGCAVGVFVGVMRDVTR